ncbi:MAG: PilN domain-containing protein [Pelovirga sp.]
MIRINLLPIRAAQRKQKMRSQLSVFVLILVLAVAVCGGLYIQQQRTNDNLQAEIADINRRNAELQARIGEVRDIEKKKADLEQKLTVLGKLKSDKTGPVRLLDDLSNALPDELWLTSYAEQNGSIDLAGVADTEQRVALFMQQLEASGHYSNVELSVTEQTTVGNRKMQRFSLKGRAVTPVTN